MSRLYTPPVIKFTPRRNRPTPNPTTHNPAPHPTTAAPKPTTPPCDLAPRAVSSPTPATATAHTPTTTSCYYTEDTPSRSVEEATKTAKPAPTPESNSSPQSAPSLGKPPEKSESGSGCYYGDCGLKPGIEPSPPKLQVGPQDQGNGNTNAPPPTNSQIELCTYGSSEEDVPIPEAIVHDRLNEKHSSDMYYSGEVIPKQAKTPEGKEREGGGEDEVQDAEVYYGTAPSGTSSTAGSETNAFSHQIPNQVYGSTQPLSADERKESSGSPESDSHSEEDSDTAGNHSHSDDDDDEESTAASGESVLTLNATYGSSETRENNCLPTSQKSDTCGMAYGESEEINTTTPSSPKATVPTHKEGEVTTEDSPHQVTEKYYGSTSSNQEPTVHVKAVAPIPVDSPSNHYEEITVHASPTLEADNKTTVERDSTSSVHPPEDPKRNWNEEFQSLFEKPVTTPFDRNVRGQNLKKLLDDFERFAAQTACCIVTEIGVDNKEKQLPPIGGGRAGGEKFKHGNILFKFARDYAKMYGSDEMARKTAANELRNMNAVIDCNLPNLHVPLTTLINLYGHTIVATAIVPIGEDSLVYGTPDAGKTVKDSDPVVKGMMKQIATRLSLQPHLFRELEFFAAADVECHRSKVDGRYYLIDCGRLLPPRSHDKGHREHLVYLFRPEFMRSYCMGHSVSSDSFSGFAKLDPLCSQHNHDADVAISILEDRALRNAIESLITGSETGTSPLMDLSSAKLSTHFHTAGVNIGLIGKACLLAQDLKSPQLAAILCEEAICRTLKSVLREEMRNVLEKRKFSEKVMTQVAKSFLSRTFCSPSSKTKSPLWTAVVKRCLEKYDFAVTPSSANIQSSSFIHRLQEQLGLAWDLAAMDPSRSLCDFVTGCSPSIQLLKIPPFFQKEAAEKFCLEELAVREKALGASHPALVSTLLAIVDLYFQWVPSGGSSGTDSFHLCASAAERAVAITKEHDWDCLVKAGQIYLSFGDLERAEVYFKKLYQFSSETNHPKLGQSINNLAIIYKKIGKLEQAKEMYVKALEIHQRNNAKDLIASTSMNIGILSREMKQISEARKYYTFAEKLFREVLEENNPRLLSCQTSLSNVLAKEGNFTECKELLSRVFSKLTEGVGGEHVKLAYMYSSYSYLHRRMREYETSKDYIMKAIEVWKRLNRSDTIEYAIALEGLVYLHHHTGCTAEATAVLKEVISILTSKKTLLADARAVKRAHKLAAILGVSLEGSPLAHS